MHTLTKALPAVSGDLINTTWLTTNMNKIAMVVVIAVGCAIIWGGHKGNTSKALSSGTVVIIGIIVISAGALIGTPWGSNLLKSFLGA